MSDDDHDLLDRRRKRQAKRINKHLDLGASYFNGAALAVLALGVFRFVLDPATDSAGQPVGWTVGLIGLSALFHGVAQLLYLLLKPED